MSTGSPIAPAAVEMLASRLIDGVAIVRRRLEERPLERRAATIFAMRVGSAGLLFIIQVLLARWLGASEYGIFAALWTSVLVVGEIGRAHV